MGKNSLRFASASAVIAGLALTAVPIASFGYVSVGVSINVAPPALPVYVQPACPGIGYIWTPGYWAWDDGDYYWVPGTWVLAPSPGLLWTPGYWGWGGGVYLWHPGYWGPHVGFYGGINYGYGYTGVGFDGGYWRGHDFYYNRAVNNLGGVHVTNVYNTTVVNNVTVNRVSFNGGTGGTHARPNGRELSAEHERHVDFTPMQREHEHMAFGNHDLRASVNGGKPRIAATARPTVFTGRDVIGARAAGAPYHGGDHGGPGSGRAADAHAGGPGRGPDLRGADHGAPGAGHGGDVRADRPGRGAETHAGGPAADAIGHGDAPHTAVMRNDRPPSATGAGRGADFHTAGGAANHSDVPHGAAMRNDRPSGVGGGASARGAGDGPGAGHVNAGGGSGRGAEFHSGGPAVAHNDRPPSGGGPPNAGNGAPFHNEQARAPQARLQTEVQQPHINQMNQMRAERSAPQGHPSGGSPQAAPRQFNGGGGQEFNRGGSGREFGGGQPAPRPQAAPRPQSAPQQFAAPRQEVQRGGGEPRGQGRPQQESRGPHDRR